MRAAFALRLGVGLALCGGACVCAPAAQASSFVTLGVPAPKQSPSFVVLGEPAAEVAPPEPARQAGRPRSPLDAAPDYAWDPAPVEISPSIVVLGEPAVEEIEVAAIPEPPRPQPKPKTVKSPSEPKVIRAGLEGEALPRFMTPEEISAPQPDPTAPQADPNEGPPDPGAPPPEQPAAMPPGRELGAPR